MRLKRSLSWLRILAGRSPGQLVIQYTDACNAHCPQCGMRVGAGFSRSTLSVDKVKGVIDTAARNNFCALSLTGGEPLLRFDELCTLLDYAVDQGIKFLRTGTNGFIFRGAEKSDFNDRIKRFADRLAQTPLRNFWISLDSANPATHAQMRGLPGVVEGIEKALPIFHERGLYPSANLGINRNLAGAGWLEKQVADGDLKGFGEFFREAFAAFYEQTIALGFTIVNVCYPMSFDKDESGAVYDATSSDAVVAFSRLERAMLYRSLATVIPSYRHRIRIFTPLCSLNALALEYENDGRSNAYPCLGGVDYFFIAAANGQTFPCGFRGQENFGDFSEENWRQNAKSACRACDWECFRDPSELLGPLLAWRRPWDIWKRWCRDQAFFRTWFQDLSYYRACDYFDGRRPLNRKRLNKFAVCRPDEQETGAVFAKSGA